MRLAHRPDSGSQPLQLPRVPGVPRVRDKFWRLAGSLRRIGSHPWFVAIIGGLAAIVLAAYLFGIG